MEQGLLCCVRCAVPVQVGPTGTGKSVYIGRHLVSTLPKEKWVPTFVTFSARTTANMTQDQVGGRKAKRGQHKCWDLHKYMGQSRGL